MFTLSCYSADEPYTGQSKAEKPGRAGEEKQAVKSKPGPVADFASIGAFFPGWLSLPMQLITQPGSPYPLGATIRPAGVNFSVFSKSSARVELLLFDGAEDARPSAVIPLDPTSNRTYHYWHVFVPGVQAGADLRLSGLRAVRAEARIALRPRQGAAGPIRQGGRRAGGLQPHRRFSAG